jgi:hypothetical protein
MNEWEITTDLLNEVVRKEQQEVSMLEEQENGYSLSESSLE